MLRVSMGWVAFQVGGREAFIPAGADLRHAQARRSGHSVLEDAPEALRRGVERFEQRRPAAL